MKRLYESDLVIVLWLILIVGAYKVFTNEHVQEGVVRFVERAADVSRWDSPNDQVNEEPQAIVFRRQPPEETGPHYFQSSQAPRWVYVESGGSPNYDDRCYAYPTRGCGH